MTDIPPDRSPEAAAVFLAQEKLDATKLSEHAGCVLCGKTNPVGFRLDFRVQTPGTVRALFSCSRLFQSYPETLHGGVVSALFDAAMSNCLFSLGEVAVTAELTVRYLRPTRLDLEAEVIGQLKKSSWPMFYLTAELRQQGIVLAQAEAKFIGRRWVNGT
jgi:acyl-coenzyme A thioesterase PaaI-like protein